MPELSFDDFTKLDLNRYKWIHFEVVSQHICKLSSKYTGFIPECYTKLVYFVNVQGRNAEEYTKMIKCVHEWNATHSIDKKIAVSAELEKIHINYRLLSGLVDDVFVVKDFAMSKGYNNKEDVARSFLYDLNPEYVVNSIFKRLVLLIPGCKCSILIFN